MQICLTNKLIFFFLFFGLNLSLWPKIWNFNTIQWLTHFVCRSQKTIYICLLFPYLQNIPRFYDNNGKGNTHVIFDVFFLYYSIACHSPTLPFLIQFVCIIGTHMDLLTLSHANNLVFSWNNKIFMKKKKKFHK